MNFQDFTEALELAVMNIHDAVERGGVYGILMGNVRAKGTYYNLSSLVERIAPGRLIDEVIKVHNCKSDSSSYKGNFVRLPTKSYLYSLSVNLRCSLLGQWKSAQQR